MIDRSRFVPVTISAALLALFLPALASAQGNYSYDRQTLRHTTERMKDLSRDFEKRLDQSFDRSGYEDTNVERRVLQLAKDFQRATGELDDRIEDNRDLGRSYEQARRVLQLGRAIDGVMSRNRFEYQAEADWSQLRGSLRSLANVYGLGDGSGYDRRTDDDDHYSRDRWRTRWPH